MTCDEFRALNARVMKNMMESMQRGVDPQAILKSIDESSTLSERNAGRKHLQSCPSCQNVLGELEKTASEKVEEHLSPPARIEGILKLSEEIASVQNANDWRRSLKDEEAG
jgi:hypothetical protein